VGRLGFSDRRFGLSVFRLGLWLWFGGFLFVGCLLRIGSFLQLTPKLLLVIHLLLFPATTVSVE
jgi:hypothetical protein